MICISRINKKQNDIALKSKQICGGLNGVQIHQAYFIPNAFYFLAWDLFNFFIIWVKVGTLPLAITNLRFFILL